MALTSDCRYTQKIHGLLEKVASSSLTRRIAGGAFWSFSGALVQKILLLISSIACAKILGKELFGELGLVRSTINMFVLLGAVGMGITASKYIAEYRDTQKQQAGNIFLITNIFGISVGVIVSALVFIFSEEIAIYLNAPHLKVTIQIGALLLFCAVVNGVQNGVLSGMESFRAIAINTIISAIVEICAILLGAYFWQVNGALLGYAIGFFILAFLNCISIHHVLKQNGIRVFWNKIRLQDLSIIYKFSLPAMCSSLMVIPVFWYIKTMLVKSGSDGFGELAIYEAADQWKMIILFIPSAISRIALPILSNTHGVRDRNNYIRILKINLMLNIGVSLVMALIIVLASRWIMVMYGKGFDNPYPLIALAVSTLFSSIAAVVGSAIASRSKMWIGLCFNLLWGAMTIGFTYLFLQLGMRASALACAVCCAYAIHAGLQSIYLFVLLKNNLE